MQDEYIRTQMNTFKYINLRRKKFMIRSSQIEYQGISVIKKDYPILERLAANYYSNLRLKDNLHVCLEYFGTKYKLDKHLEKEKELFPEKCIGKPVQIPIIGIGAYAKDGVLMNIAFLIDDTEFAGVHIGDRTLYDYCHNDCPNITIYTAEGTYTDEKGRVRPITSTKKSYKCFQPDMIDPNEKQGFIAFDEPVYVTGQLAVFRGQNPEYRIKNDVPRLVSNKGIRAMSGELLECEFEDDIVRKGKEDAKKTADAIFS